MSIVLTALSSVLAVCVCITLTRCFHMLQLNSYFNSRYFDYLKGEFTFISVCSAFFGIITAVACLVSPVAALIIGMIVNGVRIWYTVIAHKGAKKRLVFTARVKRMYLTAAVLSLILILLGTLFPSAQLIIICVQCVFIIFSPLFAMLINLINAPLEGAFRHYYINDAKKILENHNKMTVIGLTGSYGKTSTKHILARMLSEKYNVCATPGGINTPLGIVRAIRENLKPADEVFIVEMGAKKLYDIDEICRLVNPDTGIITSIGPQHLNTFGSIENVQKTKFELADAVKKNGGRMYLNIDSELIADKAKNYDHISYSAKSGDVYADNIRCTKSGLEFDIIAKKRVIPVKAPLLGMHNVLNILAAAAVAIDLGLSDTDIKYAVSKLKPTEHRLELKPFVAGSVLIDDAYNANPEGSKEAMRVIGSFAPMKRIVVTPGLVELGEKEYECNKQLGFAAAENADELIFVGEKRSVPLVEGANEYGFDKEHMTVVKTFKDAYGLLVNMCDKNTVVIFENDLPDNYAK